MHHYEYPQLRCQQTIPQVHVQGPRSRTRLLTFFWCPSTACDLVMATGQGLELYQRSPKGQGLRYMGSRKHPTTWCTYSHDSRIALLATGEGGLWLQVTPKPCTHTQKGAQEACQCACGVFTGIGLFKLFHT